MDEFSPLVDPFELQRIAVTRMPAAAVGKGRRTPIDSSSRSLIGTLVHRLFERAGTSLADESRPEPVDDAFARLIREEEVVEAGHLEEVFGKARGAYFELCRHPELSGALASGDAIFEVPFSVRPSSSNVILRGTFDCLVKRRDGGVTLLELKTGKPAPEHDRQLEIYLTAARAMFPGTPVEGILAYARQPNLDDRPLHTER